MGFLMATCMFLMIGTAIVKPDTTDEVESIEMFVDGQVNIEASENGRYQGFTDAHNGGLYMIETRTGVLYYFVAGKPTIWKDSLDKNKGKWVRSSPDTDWIEE